MRSFLLMVLLTLPLLAQPGDQADRLRNVEVLSKEGGELTVRWQGASPNAGGEAGWTIPDQFLGKKVKVKVVFVVTAGQAQASVMREGGSALKSGSWLKGPVEQTEEWTVDLPQKSRWRCFVQLTLMAPDPKKGPVPLATLKSLSISEVP